MRALIALLAACNNSSSTPPAPETKPVSGLDQLKVTIDGKPVGMAKAYLKGLPAGRWQLYVTSAEATCKELMTNLFDSRPGAQTLLLNIGHRLAPDGTLATVVTDVFIRGSGEVAPGSSASVDGDKVTLAYRATGDGHAYAVSGSLVAAHCGEPPKPLPPATATVTVAGVTLPLVAAIGKGDDLVLSTGPKDCTPSTPWAEVILERTGGAWHLSGEWFGQTLQNSSLIDRKTGQPETKDLAVTRSGTALALAGSGAIGGYPVALAGTIQAAECAR